MLASTANRISKRIVKHAASNVYTKCLYQKKWQTEICHFTMSIQCFPVHATHLPRRAFPTDPLRPNHTGQLARSLPVHCKSDPSLSRQCLPLRCAPRLTGYESPFLVAPFQFSALRSPAYHSPDHNTIPAFRPVPHLILSIHTRPVRIFPLLATHLQNYP